jgi:hypothetical protein
MTQSRYGTTDSTAVNPPQVVPSREGYDRWAPSMMRYPRAPIICDTDLHWQGERAGTT